MVNFEWIFRVYQHVYLQRKDYENISYHHNKTVLSSFKFLQDCMIYTIVQNEEACIN